MLDFFDTCFAFLLTLWLKLADKSLVTLKEKLWKITCIMCEIGVLNWKVLPAVLYTMTYTLCTQKRARFIIQQCTIEKVQTDVGPFH